MRNLPFTRVSFAPAAKELFVETGRLVTASLKHLASLQRTHGVAIQNRGSADSVTSRDGAAESGRNTDKP